MTRYLVPRACCSIPSLTVSEFLPTRIFYQAIFVALVLFFQSSGAVQVFAQEDFCVSGKELFEEQRYPEAREMFRKCLDANGESAEALIPLAVIAVSEERLEAALDYASRAVIVAPDDPDSHYWYGRALLRSEEVEKARIQWEEGLRLSVVHPGLLEGMARLSLKDNEPAKAYNLLLQLQRQGVDDSWLHRLLAEISADKGLWAASLDHLEQAIARDGETVKDLLLASQLALLDGKQDRAISFCRRAVFQQPVAAAYGALGEAYFSAGEMDSAFVYLTLAVSNEPENPHYHFNLANVLEVGERYEEASTHFQQYIKLAPEDPVGHFNYCIHLNKQGRSQAALKHAEEAIRLDGNMLTARLVRAQIQESMGLWEDALSGVNNLIAEGVASDNQLAQWSAKLQAKVDESQQARQQGKIHLLHMVVANQKLVDMVVQELASGADFESLVVRFSSGPAAARGGDIGWIAVQEMVEPLKSAIVALDRNDISPPIESQGLYHFFKRVH